MKKIILLSIALITAGFLSALAQNNVTMPEQLNRQSTLFENLKLQTHQRAKTGQGWWEPDTVYVFFNGKENKAADVVRYIYEYQHHSEELLVERIEQWPKNNAWVNGYLFTFTYDSNHNLLDESRKKWENNKWVSYDSWTISSIYTYDSNNNLITRLEQTLLSNSLVNLYLYTYTYDFNNNLLNELCKKWNNDSWENYYQVINTYDSNDNKLSEIHQNWNNNSWDNYNQIEYYYDSTNKVLKGQEKIWRNNSWEINSQVAYTYDSINNISTELYQGWINSLWENKTRYIRFYDDNRNGISVERFVWIDESWQPSQVGMSTMIALNLDYNYKQNMVEMWGCDKMTATYKNVFDLTSIAPPPTTPQLNAISVYPNPTKGELRIENGKLRIENVKIYDIFGKQHLILHSPFSILNSIDISHLPAGTYFVQITTEKGVVTKKVVKM